MTTPVENTSTTPVAMTPIQIKMQELKDKTAARQAEIQDKLEMKRVEKQISFVSSDAYESQLVAQTKLDRMNSNIQTVVTMMNELQKIPAETLPGTGEIKVRSFATGTQYFGQELGHILGLLNTLRQLFLDKQVVAAYNIVPSSVVEVEAVMNAFGKTTYYNKNQHKVVDQEMGNYANTKLAISSFADSIGCEDIDMSRFSEEAYKAFYENETVKANKKKEQVDAAIELEKQTIEDGEGRTTINPDNM